MNKQTVCAFSILGAVLLVCGCSTTERSLGVSKLEPERRNQPTETDVRIDSLSFERAADVPSLCVRVSGEETEHWEELPRTEKRTEVIRQSYDAPTYCRMTKAVPPFSLSWNFFGSKWGFGLTKQLGFMPVSKWISWRKVFAPSRVIGFFPCGKELMSGGTHPLKAVSLGNGGVDCPVFPCTVSDEELYSLLVTCIYPIALIGIATDAPPFKDDRVKYLLAPFLVGLNPAMDVVAYSLDVTAMTGAASLEAAVAPLPPVIDVTAMTTACSLDLCPGSVVVASDTALAPLTVVGDGLVWMGDAVYPGKVTHTTNVVVSAGDSWEKKSTERPRPVKLDAYQLKFECAGGVSKVVPLDASGRLTLPLSALKSETSFGNPIQKVTVTLVDSSGPVKGAQPKQADVDFDALQSAPAAQTGNTF